MWDKKDKIRQELGKLIEPSQDGGNLLGEALLKGAAKSLYNLGRIGASKAIKSDVAKRKIKGIANKYLDQALDSFSSDLSKKLDPFHRGGSVDYSNWYQRGKGILLPFPFVDWKKAWNVISDPGLFKGPEVSAKEGKALVAEYKRQYKAYKDAGGSRSYNSWIKWKGYGKGLDIHKAILKGFVMPGHRYTGPGKPLEEQLKYDPNTGQILEIYQQPTGKTDAVSMQHDVDYSVCGNKPQSDQVKCKNDADRKMVKALDAIPWKQRQWGHAIARNAIAAKSKLGMGAKSKNVKSRRVKKTGKKN